MVFISVPNSKTLTLNLDPKSTTVFSLQQSIQHHTQIPISHQRLLLPNSPINNSSTFLSQLHITAYSTLILHFPLLGGSQPPPVGSDFLNSNPPANYGPARAAPDRSATAIGNDVRLFASSKYKVETLEIFVFSIIRECHVTDLKIMEITSDAKISDIENARLLLKSVRETNSKHPPGWIAAVRLEEMAGDIKQARKLIKEGCKECPTSENVCLEACRLAVLNEVLEHIIPDALRCWKADVERLKADVERAANEEDKRLLLYKAVECCPLYVEFWLALARLETYGNSKKLLNKAKMYLPKEPAICIAAAKLEEADVRSMHLVGTVIELGMMRFKDEGVVIDRKAWMKEAEAAERAGSVALCQAIIKSTVGIGVEDEDRKRTWIADAEECKERGFIETARAIYAHARTVFSTKKSIWLKAAQLEKSHGTSESLDTLLRKAVSYMPDEEVFWLMGAKEKWLAGDVNAARRILQEANAEIPDSEVMLLAAFKLEFETHEPERARLLLLQARERVGTERVWMKSAILEREQGNTEEEGKFIEEGLKRFPSFYKLWLMLGQLKERLGELDEAKKAYETGLERCSSCVPLWLSLANLEENVNGISIARAVLERARTENPRQPQLWLAAIRFESRHGHREQACLLMERALKECPNSGVLWAAEIEMMVPSGQQRSLEKCDDCSHVFVAQGKRFWHARNVDDARLRFEEAVKLSPDFGDFWALYYKFELEHGTEEKQKDVLERCIAAKPRYG